MTPVQVRDGVTIYNADCLDVLPTLEAGSIDLALSDPPYGIDYASSWTTRPDGTPRRKRNSFGVDEFADEWIAEVYRLLKANACFYCFTRWDVLHQWKQSIEAAGFKVKQRLVWNKCHWKMGDLRYYGSQTEDVLFCTKGNPPMYWPQRAGNLFSSSSSAYLPEGQYDHPTQKPEVIMRRFILDSTTSDATVIDPFMGSGTTGAACIQLGRRFIGIERDPAYFEVARQRLTNAKTPLLYTVDDIDPEQLPLAV